MDLICFGAFLGRSELGPIDAHPIYLTCSELGISVNVEEVLYDPKGSALREMGAGTLRIRLRLVRPDYIT